MSDFKEWVERSLEIVQRQEDGEYTVRCPWHGGTSMRVNVNRGLFTCFGCGVKGNHKLLIRTVGGDYAVVHRGEAVKAKLAAMQESEDVRIYTESWLDRFDTVEPHPYWRTRGFDSDIVARFRLGYDYETECVTIPLRHQGGRPIGVIRRHLNPEARPRYVYPKGFKLKTHVWNLHNHTRGSRVALVEGSLDAIAMEQAGIPAIALLGSRLSEPQALDIRRAGIRHVTVCTDCDDAGEKVIPDLHQLGAGVRVDIGCYDPSWSGTDPGALTLEERAALFDNVISLRQYAAS